MTRLLYRLLKAYFYITPNPKLDWVYRYFLVAGVHFYRFFIRPWIGERCQFSVSCSQFTLEQITSYKPFEVVRYECLQRYCECSFPLSSVRIGNRHLFITSEGRELDESEVSVRVRAATER